MRKTIKLLSVCLIVLVFLSSCKASGGNETVIPDGNETVPEQSDPERIEISTEDLDVPGENTMTIPVPSYTMISRGFSDTHHAVDFVAGKGTKVVAAYEGIVSETSANKNDGYYVTISHGGDLKTQYLHLDSYRVEVGDHVMAGDVIGSVGATGTATRPHRCFKVIRDGEATDPAYYLDLDID
jgi:murein DD-endopeptidase MepM/ murein hydrolase activator NlpD